MDTRITEEHANVSPIVARRKFAVAVVESANEHGGMTLLVDGQPGIGKTYLLREIIAAAEAKSQWKTTFVRADEIEQDEPFSFIERIVAGSFISDWRFVPDGTTDPVQVARECIARFLDGLEGAGRVMVFDDVQWADPQSQRVLRYMIPRLNRRNVLLAFGCRAPHRPDSFGEFLTQLVADSPVDQRYTVPALTVHDITTLALDYLGVGITLHTAQRMHDATAGSFLEVESILSALTAADLSKMHVAWDAPIRRIGYDSDRLLYQFQKLSPAARGTSEIICLADHELTLEELTATAKALGEVVELDEAIEAGVVSDNTPGISIMARHALLAQAVRDTISPERRSEIYRALAEVTDGYRALRHALSGADVWDVDLRDRVHEFVLEAAQRGSIAQASDVLRIALRLVNDAEDRNGILESLALLHMRAKTAYHVLDLLDEIEDLPKTTLREFIAIVLSAHRVGHPLPMSRVQGLLHSNPQSPDERLIVAFFAFMIVILSMRTMNRKTIPPLIAHAKMLMAQAPGELSELEDERLEWMLDREAHLVVLDCYLMVQDQFSQKYDEVTAALPQLTAMTDALPDGPLKVDALIAIAGAELAVGNLLEGRAQAQRSVEMLERVSEPWAASTARLVLADCYLLQGEYRQAEELMQLTTEVTYSSLDVETRSSWAALQVILESVTGAEDPGAHLELAQRQQEIPWEGYNPELAVLAACELARSRGDSAGVLSASSTPWTERIVNTRHGFLTFRAHALLDAGRVKEASELTEQLEQWRGERWQEYWGTLDWLKARISEAVGDWRTANWHYAAATEYRELPLPLALTLIDYGKFLSAHASEVGMSPEAGTERISEGVEILTEIGAHGYLPRAQKLLAARGISASRNKYQHLLQTLTEREVQIVEHLARGRSNNQIAEALVISPATVRSHVSNVLRKLGLSSRGEVAKVLREESAQAN